MSDDEAWRRVPSLPEYMVSSHGRIMRIPFRGVMPAGGTRHYEGRAWLGCNNTADGRMTFVYRGKTYKVHRLICEAFHGPQPADKPVCMHLDEDYQNNRPENLAWGSQKENLNAPGFRKFCRERALQMHREGKLG